MAVFTGKALCAAVSVAVLGGCASLPEPSADSADALQPLHQSRTLRIAAQPGFDLQRYDGLVAGSIRLREAQTTDEESQARDALREQFTQQLTPLLSGSAEQGLRMDVELYDIRPVSPTLNVLSAAALLLPLDSGALTLEATFRDAGGNVLVRRTERISGSVVNISEGFSRYGRLADALNDWAAQCAQWRVCVLVD